MVKMSDARKAAHHDVSGLASLRGRLQAMRW
jgi:hypothetical protein